jgi:phage-related baseplate assembly protein
MSVIDFSGLPFPNIIDPLDFETIRADTEADLIERFPAIAPVLQLESAIVVKLIQAFGVREVLLRQRVNDGLKGVLTPFAKGADLDNVAARNGTFRLVVRPEQDGLPAIMESDAALLRRYLLGFERPSAGSAARYLYEAWKAWPQNADKSLGLWDAKVNGHAVHGRRGDTDVVIIGPFGRLPTQEEKAAVRAAILAPDVRPEAVAVTLLDGRRVEYAIDLAIDIPPGPSPGLVEADTADRVMREAERRTVLGGEIPPGLMPGVAYGENVIKVTDLAPVAIAPDPYSIPVLTGVSVKATVRT